MTSAGGTGARRPRPRLPHSGRCAAPATRLCWGQAPGSRGWRTLNGEEARIGCLFAIFAGAFPRLGTLILWLARPQMFSDAFGGSWFWPVLGIISLPFTTLMYVLLWTPVNGVGGFDWAWLGLSVLLDLLHWGGAAAGSYNDRDRIPNVYSRNMTA